MIAPEIASPAVTRHSLTAFGLRASKRLGQNFLVDGSAIYFTFFVCKIVCEVAASLRLGCCLSVDKPSGIC